MGLKIRSSLSLVRNFKLRAMTELNRRGEWDWEGYGGVFPFQGG
jgi:hypothetical protein